MCVFCVYLAMFTVTRALSDVRDFPTLFKGLIELQAVLCLLVLRRYRCYVNSFYSCSVSFVQPLNTQFPNLFVFVSSLLLVFPNLFAKL